MDAVVLSTPEQIDFFRLATVIRCMETHIRTGGTMRLTRMATPTAMREIASEYTGKRYARSMKGLETALADLNEIKAKALQ
jgi:hypothetical protein